MNVYKKLALAKAKLRLARLRCDLLKNRSSLRYIVCGAKKYLGCVYMTWSAVTSSLENISLLYEPYKSCLNGTVLDIKTGCSYALANVEKKDLLARLK